MARDMGRDPPEVATMAIEAYIEANSGTPGVPHEEVMEWLTSWGTDHELPRPTPRREGAMLY
jgi:predicted transcriptional regulator